MQQRLNISHYGEIKPWFLAVLRLHDFTIDQKLKLCNAEKCTEMHDTDEIITMYALGYTCTQARRYHNAVIARSRLTGLAPWSHSPWFRRYGDQTETDLELFNRIEYQFSCIRESSVPEISLLLTSTAVEAVANNALLACELRKENAWHLALIENEIFDQTHGEYQ